MVNPAGTRSADVLAAAREYLGREVRAEDTFEELGLDSLELLDLILAVQKACGVNLSDEQIARAESIGDLALAARSN